MAQQTTFTIVPKSTNLPGSWNPVVGDHTQQLEQHLRQAKVVVEHEEFRRVREEARRILAQCLPPGQESASRTGLVVGYVQSGKTVSMTAVATLARDNGIRLLIAFSGTTKNLFNELYRH